MTCCFIGHRRIKHKKELASRLRDNICYLLEQGVATFLFGDHSEFNTLCYKVVSELREVYPQIRRIHYRTDYPDADAYTMQFLLDGYEDSICPDGVAAAGKAAYVERNQAMIQASDFCVFYFNNEYLPASRKESKKAITSYQPKSGTGIAFDYINGVYHKAVIDENIKGTDTVFDFKDIEQSMSGKFEINPQNATQLLCDGTVYQVTSDTVSNNELGSYIGILAENVIFNAETKIPLSKEELRKIDWYGENAGQHREQWIYKDIYEIHGTEKTEAVAVQINDRYYIAKRQ